MVGLRELLVCGFRPAEVALLRKCAERGGTKIRPAGSPVEAARLAVARRPGALILGLDRDTLDNLLVIPVIRQIWPEVPVSVVAYEDSLNLERRARQAGVFYYSVHPMDAGELEAVLEDLRRRSDRGCHPRQGI